MSKTFYCSAHPLTMLYYIRRFAVILLFPVLRALINIDSSGGISAIVKIELLLTAVLILLGIFRWKRCRIIVNDGFFCLRVGLLFTRVTHIRLERITSIYVQRHPLIALFGAVRVSINTDAGLKSTPKLRFYLSNKKADNLCHALEISVPKNKLYLCNTAQIILMSLSNASALSGLLIAASLIENGGKLLGDILQTRLVETINLVTALTSRLIPPAATVIAAALVTGFFVSFLITLIKHLSFVVRCNKTCITVEQGFIWRKRSFINRKSVAAAIVTSPPLLRLFGCCSLRLVASGFGNESAEKSVVFPVEKISRAKQSMRTLGIKNCCHDISLRVERRAVRRAAFMPTVIFILITGAAILSGYIFTEFARLITLVAISAGVVVLYWLILRLEHTYRGGAHIGGDVRVFGYSALTLNDAYFEADKLDSILISEGPFDRRNGFCSLRATSLGKNSASIKTVNLDKTKTLSQIKAKYGV